MNSERVQDQSRDVIVKLAAYAALTGATLFVFRAVLVLIFTAMLRDPANQDLAPAFRSILELASAAIWGLLLLVAVGLFRIARPSSAASKAGMVFAGLGVAVLVLDQLAVAATGTYLFSPRGVVSTMGAIAIAGWLVLVNGDLQRREILSRGLTQLGLAYGVGLAIVSIDRWINVTHLLGGPTGVALVSALGNLAWLIWLGVALLRLQPIERSASFPTQTSAKSQTSSQSLSDRLNTIRIPRWLGWLAVPVGILLGVLGWWRYLS